MFSHGIARSNRSNAVSQVQQPELADELQSSSASIRSFRKRRFFGRGRSDAGELISKQLKTVRESEVSDTALSTGARNGKHHRSSKSDGLDSVRASFFGMRRPHHTRNKLTRPSSRSDDQNSIQLSSNQYDSAQDYYRHLRLRSISQPYNFQHIDHASIPEHSALETPIESTTHLETHQLDQIDETPETTTAYRKKRQHRQMSITEAPLAYSPPASPPRVESRPISGYMGVRTEPLDRPTEPFYPRSDSSDSSDSAVSVRPGEHSYELSYDSDENGVVAARVSSNTRRSRDSLLDPFIATTQSSRKEMASIQDQAEPRNAPSMSSMLACTAALSRLDIDTQNGTDVSLSSTEMNTPLSLWTKTPQSEASKLSLRTSSITTGSSVSLRTKRESGATSPTSKCSSRSSCGQHKPSKHYSGSNEERIIDLLVDAAWEEDVDFCYEQEAESTCNFNWHNISKEGGRPASKETTTSVSGNSFSSAGRFPVIGNKNESFEESNQSSESLIEQRRAHAVSHHQRGSSVGHRGFLASRQQSNDLKNNASTLLEPPSSLQIGSRSGGTLSPVPSIRGDSEGMPLPLESPLTPGFLHCTRVDDVLHACDGSIQAAKYMPFNEGLERNESRQSQREIRNAVTSQRRQAARTSFKGHKSRASEPRASLARPAYHRHQLSLNVAERKTYPSRDSKITPNDLKAFDHGQFTIRRPETPEDRILLQAAGRASQRGRPMSPQTNVRDPDSAVKKVQPRRPARTDACLWI